MNPLSKPQVNVLFIDTDNAWRSILAEALLGQWGGGRFRGFSAGTHPAARVHPDCGLLLQQLGLARADLHCKSWDHFHQPGAPVMDFVFTLCEQVADEAWPAWPGSPITAAWSLPDPLNAQGCAAEQMLACRELVGMIERRIRILVSLRLENIRRGEIRRTVRNIDRAEAA